MSQMYTVRMCSVHQFYGVFLGNQRVTARKCCGRWDVLVCEVAALPPHLLDRCTNCMAAAMRPDSLTCSFGCELEMHEAGHGAR